MKVTWHSFVLPRSLVWYSDFLIRTHATIIAPKQRSYIPRRNWRNWTKYMNVPFVCCPLHNINKRGKEERKSKYFRRKNIDWRGGLSLAIYLEYTLLSFRVKKEHFGFKVSKYTFKFYQSILGLSAWENCLTICT